jgi:hypothetical protein
MVFAPRSAQRAVDFGVRIILQRSRLQALQSKDRSNSLIPYCFDPEIGILDERQQ